ncbi:argonaute/piwi family protein [Ralstonia pickettii]|uniref:argonaute/piwi family protein n=1 Tax=Ralstonia pickettii TaxID=329 RepID=UPI0005671A42|nr:hypothetical protein [Ralstonia pickettii]
MMKLDFLEEPELEFGGHHRHVDMRQGIALFGPLDSIEGQARRIRLGVVGTQQTVDGILQWLERSKAGIKAKASRQPHLFPDFPGFGADSAFRAEFDIDSTAVRTLSNRELNRITAQSQLMAVAEGQSLLSDEVQAISESCRPDVVIVGVPPELVALEDEEASEATAEFNPKQDALEYGSTFDLRNMLKAKVMRMNQPIQLVLPQTYDDAAKGKTSKRGEKRVLQDEATRAWNFHTALYYKANYRPWRIVRDASELHACFVGISFYRSLDQANLVTSMAQVYDERGEGVIVRGKAVELSKDDRQPHLSRNDAHLLLTTALKEYRREHKHPPARVVVHKSSKYSAEELDGFNGAVDDQGLETADFLVITKSFTRLFRDGNYPPLRGTMLSLDPANHLLYTRGSVPYYATYPGMYVPRPLKFQIAQADTSPRKLAEEILALTKLNWNNTQFDGAEPITMRVAHQVGKVLKYVREGDAVQPRYSFYM